MSDDPADPGSRPGGDPGPSVVEQLDESECLQLIGTRRLGHLAYTSPFGPTVLPVVYTVYEKSIVFHTLPGTSTEADLRTGIANAEYQVAFEVDQFDPDRLEGWFVVAVGSAHHVDTDAERASIISAGADPLPRAASDPLVRVYPTRIHGRRRLRA
jgi:nitroimidazol reductase NimA-like FMN-containing flavoprotein (pyridoxamine 5'-phosphate oxidase superfamily)